MKINLKYFALDRTVLGTSRAVDRKCRQSSARRDLNPHPCRAVPGNLRAQPSPEKLTWTHLIPEFEMDMWPNIE